MHPKKTQIKDNCDLRALRKDSNPLPDCWKEFFNKGHDLGARNSVAMSVVGKKRNFTRKVQVLSCQVLISEGHIYCDHNGTLMAIISASDSGDGEIWAPTFTVNQLRQFLEFFRTVWTSLLRWQAYRLQSPPSMSHLARRFSMKRGFDRIKLDEDRNPLWVIIRRWPWPSWKVVDWLSADRPGTI